MNKIEFDFEGMVYSAGDADRAYAADAFELPNGRGLRAKWIEAAPPRIDSVSEADLAKLARPLVVVKVALVAMIAALSLSVTACVDDGCEVACKGAQDHDACVISCEESRDPKADE